MVTAQMDCRRSFNRHSVAGILFPPFPGVETPGYLRLPLRGKNARLPSRSDRLKVAVGFNPREAFPCLPRRGATFEEVKTRRRLGHLKFLGLAAVGLWLAAGAGAAEWHVDNVKGGDAVGDGSAAKPFKTIARAFKEVKTSDAVYLAPNAAPYTEHVNFPVGGTAEKPFVFDGRGAVINMLTHYTGDKWKDEGGGVFSMSLPNNAHVMDKQWWGFDLVFFDGKAGKNCASRETLEPLGYFLFKQRQQIEGKFHPLHNTLYVKLPDGKTPADIKVEAPGVGTILHCGRPHVTIRDLTAMYCTQDGFATTRAPGIVFERVRGCFNMDQGISHHGAEVTVRDSRFDHNAGCGIVDVYPEVKARYERCLVEDDTFRGGVEFHNGEFVMEDCVIRGNPGSELGVCRPGTRVILRNCLVIGREGGKDTGIQQGGGSLTLERCTFYRLRTGVVVGAGAAKLAMSRCAFIACEQNYLIQPPGKDAPSREITIDDNVYAPAPLTVDKIVYKPEQWAEFQAKTGFDSHSTMKKIDDPSSPWTLPSLKGKGRDGGDIGASLDPALFQATGSGGK